MSKKSELADKMYLMHRDLEASIKKIKKGCRPSAQFGERYNTHSRTLLLETILPLYRNQIELVKLVAELIPNE